MSEKDIEKERGTWNSEGRFRATAAAPLDRLLEIHRLSG